MLHGRLSLEMLFFCGADERALRCYTGHYFAQFGVDDRLVYLFHQSLQQFSG